MLIESYLLEQFEAVARCGTLLKASEELHISQPSFNKYAEIGNKECKWFRSINQNYPKFKEDTMEFEKLIRERYSCRKLKDTPIEKEKLERILEACIAAPTGCNYQPYKLWVLTGEENCRVMSELTKYTFGAGTFIVVGADPSKAWTRKYDGLNISTIDASIVATHLMLGIHDAGLGSTWVGSFNAPEMKKRYPEMQDYELIAIFPIGEIEEEARPAKLHYERKGISEMVRFDLMPTGDEI